MNTLSTREEFVSFKGIVNFMSLNWTKPYDEDVILQIPVLIRVLEPISVPNQSGDSFILKKMNTLSTGEEFVVFKGIVNFMSLNWTKPYDEDVILQFPILIRVLQPISVPNQSGDSFILIKMNTLSTGEEFVSFKGIVNFMSLKTLFPLEANKLFSCGQSIQFY